LTFIHDARTHEHKTPLRHQVLCSFRQHPDQNCHSASHQGPGNKPPAYVMQLGLSPTTAATIESSSLWQKK